jgi:outer membrane protein assembly factor BamB
VWTYPTGGVVYSSPAIAADGTIYVGSEDGWLHAINPDGSRKWAFTGAGDWIDSSPAIGPDGTIYFGCWDNHVYAIDPADGTEKWRYATGNLVIASPAIDAAGNIYFGSNDGIFYSLTPGGSLRWMFLAQGEIDASAAISGDGGTVYFGDTLGYFYALSTLSGAQKWRYQILLQHPDTRQLGILAAPAIGYDGTVYVGSQNGRLYAFGNNSNGAPLWTFTATEAIDNTPVIGADGAIYFASRDGYVYAVNPQSGAPVQLWESLVGDVFYASPALSADGHLIVAAYAGEGFTQVVALDRLGEPVWQMFVAGFNDSSPAIGADGSVYVGMHDYSLYRIHHGAPIAAGPWPKFRRSLVNRGRAGTPGDTFEDYFPARGLSDGPWTPVTWWGDLAGQPFPWIFHRAEGWSYCAGAGGNDVWHWHAASATWRHASPLHPGWFWYPPESDTPGRWSTLP